MCPNAVKKNDVTLQETDCTEMLKSKGMFMASVNQPYTPVKPQREL